MINSQEGFLSIERGLEDKAESNFLLFPPFTYANYYVKIIVCLGENTWGMLSLRAWEELNVPCEYSIMKALTEKPGRTAFGIHFYCHRYNNNNKKTFGFF